MAAMFPGKKHRYESKLRYELCKSVGLDWKKFPLGAYDVDGTAIEQHVPVSGSLSSSFSASTSAAFPGDADSGSCSASVSPSPSSVVAASPDIELPVLDDSNHYPSDVRRMIHEYGEAYRERSRLHYKMISVGEGNSPENMDIRRNLLVRIKALSARMMFSLLPRTTICVAGSFRMLVRCGRLKNQLLLWWKRRPCRMIRWSFGG